MGNQPKKATAVWRRRLLRWSIVPAVPTLLGAVILFVPPVQNQVLQRALRYAGSKAGLEIEVDRIRLRLPFDLRVDNLRASAFGADSLLSLNCLHIRLRPGLLASKIVAVEKLELVGLQINSGDYMPAASVHGALDSLDLSAVVDLKAETAELGRAALEGANVSVVIRSSTDESESEPLGWRLRLGEIVLRRVLLQLQLPSDSLGLYASIPEAEVFETNIGLDASLYGAAHLRLRDAAIAFDSGADRLASGFDPRHVELTELQLSLDSLEYKAGAMQVCLRSMSVAERSGLMIRSLSGRAQSDSAGLGLSDFELRTSHSSLSLHAQVPSDAFADQPSNRMEGWLSASVGKADISIFVDSFESFADRYPDSPLLIELEARGNSRAMDIPSFHLHISNTLHLQASASASQLLDSLHRTAHIRFSSHLHQPRLEVDGDLDYRNQIATAELSLSDAAKAQITAMYNLSDQSYSASLQIDSLVPSSFIPFDSAAYLSAAIRAQGRGFDLFADSTVASIRGRINELRYGNSRLEQVRFGASLLNHRAELELLSDDPAAKMDFSFEGNISRNKLSGMISGNVDSLDLYTLRLTEAPFSTAFQVFAEAESDLRQTHQADVTLGNWELNVGSNPLRAKTLTLKAYSGADTTRLHFNAGDLGAILTANKGIETILRQGGILADKLMKQVRADSAIQITAIQPLFPDLALSLRAGKDNPVHSVLARSNIEFDSFGLDLSSSPADGLRADAKLFALYRDTLRIDTIRASIIPDNDGLTYKAEVLKNRFMRQTPFTALLQGSLRDEYAEAEVLYTNHQAVTGLHLGVRATKTPRGFLLNFFPDTAILAFNAFALNPNNSLLFGGIKNIEANLRFTGANNSMLWLHSSVDSLASFPTLRAELSQIPLGVITRGFITLPELEGMASADFQYAPTEESFTVAGEVHIDNLKYEGGRVGELMLNGVYMPLADNLHQVDLHFFRNMNEVSYGTAIYDLSRNRLNGSLHFEALPLEMFSPFAPQTALAGALNGQVDVSGTADKPMATGFLQLDTASVFSSALSSRFKLDSRQVAIANNIASFNKFKVFASGDNPFEIDGSVNFADLGQTYADLRFNGNNVRILDAKRGPESIAYGRLLADVSATVKGSLSALNVRGNVRLLGGTNLTYVMQESPLTVEDRLKDLLTFTSFADTTLMRRRRGTQMPPLPLGGIDMLMLVHIDPIVQLSADINPDQSSYVKLEGGGDLSFQYNRQGQTVVNGRYTLSGGKLKYALPIIPLKEFSVKPDSYIQWDGDPFNPLLGLAATQRMRTSVSLAGESPRPVDFEVGVDVRERLDNMSLLFTIAAPDDGSVQSELDRMGIEGRSTQAVGMMVTGLYLANGSSGKVNMDMGDALNSFLQSEINHIAGSALRTIDLSFGMDTYDQTPERGGGQRTDYSFRFAKRFYNDRLRIMIGGKVSSGDVPQKESFIDNASVEWRMNSAGTGYLKLFHDRNYQSILDGEVIETGAGIVLRRRMLRLSELFK